jgi:hypothetical protein
MQHVGYGKEYIGENITYINVIRTKENRLVGRSRSRCQDNIKMGTDCEDVI